MNNVFYFLFIAPVHNAGGDNLLTSFGMILEDLIATFQCDCKVAFNWFTNNKIIVYLNKFQTVSINQSTSSHKKETMDTGNEKIESCSSVKFLGIKTNG